MRGKKKKKKKKKELHATNLVYQAQRKGEIVIKPPKYCPHHWEQTKRSMETHKCNWPQKWGRGQAINKMRHQNKHPTKAPDTKEAARPEIKPITSQGPIDHSAHSVKMANQSKQMH